MQYKQLIITIVFTFSSISGVYALTTEQQEQISIGEDLHDESCLACHIATHDHAFYTRDDAKVTNMFELRSQVSRCSAFFETSWFPDEEQSVIEYLNHAHYKLPLE